MPNIDLIRTNDGLPIAQDTNGMSETEKIDALTTANKRLLDYIVRLKEQIGYELQLAKRGNNE